MWALKMMPFSVIDHRINMWKASLIEAQDLDFAIIKDGEWVATNKGKIALTVLNTKYNGETKTDLRSVFALPRYNDY